VHVVNQPQLHATTGPLHLRHVNTLVISSLPVPALPSLPPFFLQRTFRTAAQPGPTHLRIVLTEDAMHNSTQPHIIRARAILTTSSSARVIPTPSPAHLTGSVNPRLRASTSLDGAAGSSSSHHSSSGSSGGSNTSLRRLQRRSSSLLAATSATASNLWSSISALGDRSRALLCRNSPVLHHGAEPGAPSSSSGGRDGGRRSSVSSDGGARSSVSSDGVSRSGSGVVSLGVALEAGPGAVVGSGRVSAQGYVCLGLIA
jgi:hypothetical protein